MSTLTYALRDSATMLRRDLRHALRFPLMTLSSVMDARPVPAPLRRGLRPRPACRPRRRRSRPAAATSTTSLPGIILMTACSTAETTAVNVSTDMTEGIIARFRTMAITRTSVLTGQVLGGLIRTMFSGALVVAVALALGFRPTATAIEWLAATGVFALLGVALTWLTTAFGLLAKTPAGANSLSLHHRRAPLHQQRVRAHRHHAGRGRLVRPQPTVHAHHPNPARPAHRHPHRQRRRPRGRMVRRHQCLRLSVGAPALQPQPGPIAASAGPSTDTVDSCIPAESSEDEAFSPLHNRTEKRSPHRNTPGT